MKLMKTIELTDYVSAEAALRSSELKQALYNEGAVLMQDVLVTLHGDAHRSRRHSEMRVFRRDFFKHYEHSVLPQVFAQVMAQTDTASALNLVDLNYRFMVYLALQFAGIDRQSGTVEELLSLIETLRMFGVAATLGQAKDPSDAAQTSARVMAVMDQFDVQFFTPSVERRQRLLAQVTAGELSAQDLPRDVLTVLLEDATQLDMARDQVLRETGFFFLASAHTSVHSLGHAVHHLLHWCNQHPQARAHLESDAVLLQQFVHESFRLHPSSPIAKREALSRVEFLDGQIAEVGDTVIINLRQANRDPEVFGQDPQSFNPMRLVRRGTSRTGVTFGIGMHACLGKNLAAGSAPDQANGASQNHQMGTVAWICQQLLKAGVAQDTAGTARLDQSIARETWQHLPVTFTA